MTEKELEALLTLGRPVFIKDIKDKEQREKERFEMLCMAFDSVPKESVLCRDYIEKKDDVK